MSLSEFHKGENTKKPKPGIEPESPGSKSVALLTKLPVPPPIHYTHVKAIVMPVGSKKKGYSVYGGSQNEG